MKKTDRSQYEFRVTSLTKTASAFYATIVARNMPDFKETELTHILHRLNFPITPSLINFEKHFSRITINNIEMESLDETNSDNPKPPTCGIVECVNLLENWYQDCNKLSAERKWINNKYQLNLIPIIISNTDVSFWMDAEGQIFDVDNISGVHREASGIAPFFERWSRWVPIMESEWQGDTWYYQGLTGEKISNPNKLPLIPEASDDIYRWWGNEECEVIEVNGGILDKKTTRVSASSTQKLNSLLCNANIVAESTLGLRNTR